MKWIIVKEPRLDLPLDGSIFLSMWKGRICLTQFDTDEFRFYIMFEPAQYSQAWQVDPEREGKFSH